MSHTLLESIWGSDHWPADLKADSAQAILLLMREIEIGKKADGRHVVGWEVDSLDRMLDELGVYPGMCVHCYGQTGYDTREEVDANYIPLAYAEGHVHREMLKHFAYFAKADGEGILIRSLMENGDADLELLYKRDLRGAPISAGSFAFGNVPFMSQIRLPDGTLQNTRAWPSAW